MSSYCDERAEIYDDSWRRARKDHKCCACHRAIRKGEKYSRTFVLFDGDVSVYVRCVGCQTIHLHLRTLGDGEMWPDEHLNCGEEYVQHWGVEPPPLIAALAFATPDEALAISRTIYFRAASRFWFAKRRIWTRQA